MTEKTMLMLFYSGDKAGLCTCFAFFNWSWVKDSLYPAILMFCLLSEFLVIFCLLLVSVYRSHTAVSPVSPFMGVFTYMICTL